MSLDCFFLLISAIIMLLTHRTQGGNSYTVPTNLPCGPYGFRCLDTKTFQICTVSEDEPDSPMDIHECRQGLVCDEENPAYCTPVDIFTTQSPCCNQFRDVRESYDDGFQYDELIDMGQNNCGCQQETTTWPTTTSTEMIFTTDMPTIPRFNCEGYGFFPDFNNQSMFWFCDVPLSGEGFHVRHMLCGENRIYNPTHHACILIGTTRTVRDEPENSKHAKETSSSNSARSCKFSCYAKAPGRYPDENNCRLYHYCLTKEFAPVEELTLLCPYGTAYDPGTNKCSCYATYRCSNRKRSDSEQEAGAGENVEEYPEELSEESEHGMANINCEDPMRFRDVSNCDGYFLCFGDQVIQMDCPEYYKFDDSLLECLPEKIAKCQ